MTIKETSDDPCAASYFTVNPFKGVVAANAKPMGCEAGKVGQHLVQSVLETISGLMEPHATQFRSNRLRLCCSSFPRFLGKYGLEFTSHGIFMTICNLTENIPMDMHGAALPARFGKDLSKSLHES
jgi:hypothetical protein